MILTQAHADTHARSNMHIAFGCNWIVPGLMPWNLFNILYLIIGHLFIVLCYLFSF